MYPNFVINVGLPTPIEIFERIPICPPVRRAATPPPRPKAVADIVRERRVARLASPAHRNPIIQALSIAGRYKLSISRSRLDAVEHYLMVTFGVVTALLAITITTIP
jgi:hypothetical protein